MGNFIFIKVAIGTLLICLFGCKATTPYAKNDIKQENEIAYGEDIKRYRQYDELISKWVAASKEGNEVSAVDYVTKLSLVAKKEETEIKAFFDRYLKNKNDNLKTLVAVALVLAGFTNNCVFITQLERYLMSEDKVLLANSLLGISKLNHCNFNLERVLWLLENEFDETIILNALQVILQHNTTIDMIRLENIVEKFLHHRNPLIINQSIRIIAKYKIKKFKEVLINEYLPHPLTFIRINTAIALSRIGDKSIIKELIDKINEPSFIGKREIVYILENLTGQKFGLDAQAWLFWYLKNSDISK